MTFVNQLLKRTGREKIRFDCVPASLELPSRMQSVHGPNRETGPFSTFPYAKPASRTHVWTMAGQACQARDSAQEAAERVADSIARRTCCRGSENSAHPVREAGIPATRPTLAFPGGSLRSRSYASLLRVRPLAPVLRRLAGGGAHRPHAGQSKAKKFVYKDFIYPVSYAYAPFADSYANGCAGV